MSRTCLSSGSSVLLARDSLWITQCVECTCGATCKTLAFSPAFSPRSAPVLSPHTPRQFFEDSPSSYSFVKMSSPVHVHSGAAGLINVSPIVCGFVACAIKHATSYDALWASAVCLGLSVGLATLTRSANPCPNNLMGQQRKGKNWWMFLLHGFILISTHIYLYIYTVMG